MGEDLKELQKRYINFIDKRCWNQFHTPKNLTMAISVEASELMELYQWKDNIPTEELQSDAELIERTREELADTIIYCLSLAHELDIDVEEAIADKLEANEERFDLDTAATITSDLNEWKR